MRRAGFSITLSKAFAIASNTFREAVRMKLFLLLVVVALASLASSFAFREFNLGTSEIRFIADFGFGAMTLFGSIAAIVVTVQLLYGEIEHRTIMPVLARPIGRGTFLFGKLLGAWATIVCFIGSLTVGVVVALWVRESHLSAAYAEELGEGRLVSYGNVILFAALQTLRLVVLASVSVFFASYATSSLFAIFMSGFFWIIGQLQAVAGQQFSGEGGIMSWVFAFLALVVPDLRLFDLGGDIVGGETIEIATVLKLADYALAYALLYGTLAAAILKKREF